jgi:hypothetical protein
MNIDDRATLYREVCRVLKAAGRFAAYDIVKGEGEAIYPLPWARTADSSFLLTEAQTRDAVERSGFSTMAWEDQTDVARAWFEKVATGQARSGPTLALVVGPDFAQVIGSLARNLPRALTRGKPTLAGLALNGPGRSQCLLNRERPSAGKKSAVARTSSEASLAVGPHSARTVC